MNPAEAFVVSLLAKATVVFLSGAAIGFLVRNRSASTQRAVWALTLAAALGLPLGIALTPSWRVAVIPADEIAAVVKPGEPATTQTAVTSLANSPAFERTVTSSSSPSYPSVSSRALADLPSVSVMLAILWMSGVVLVLARMAIGIVGLHRVVRRSAELTDNDWQKLLHEEALLAGVERPVQLLSTGDVSTPLTFGFRAPRIILPEESSDWAPEHRAVVIRHEMAHIASADAGACLVAGITAAIYWFHPMVWMAAARLRRAQERACDDRVLTLGVAPADYAGHLLEVARSAREIGMPGFVSVAMARPSQLEGRLLAVLNDSNDRRTMTKRSKLGGIGAAAIALVMLSAFSPVKSASADTETITNATVADMPLVQQPSLVQSSVVPFAPPATAATATKFVSGDSVIEKTLTVQPGGTLLLDLETGAGLTINGSKDSRIHMRATLGGDDWRSTVVELVPDDRGARLTMRYRTDARRRSSSHHIDLSIPQEYNIRLKSSGGGLRLTDVSGEFTGSTGGGDIKIERANGSANLTTGGGAITVSSSNLNGSVGTGGGTVVIESTNGDLRGSSGSGNVVYGGKGITFSSGSANDGLRGSDGKTYINKAGGTVTLGSLDGGAQINTGGGRISIASANGDVSATTGGGDIRIGSVSGSAELSTGAGDVSVRATGASAGRVKVTSGKGTVTVTVPSDLSAYLDLETGYTEEHGRTRIRSDFEIPITETRDWDSTRGTPRRYVRSRASVGGGASGGTIRVRTTNGDIIIRKER